MVHLDNLVSLENGDDGVKRRPAPGHQQASGCISIQTVCRPELRLLPAVPQTIFRTGRAIGEASGRLVDNQVVPAFEQDRGWSNFRAFCRQGCQFHGIAFPESVPCHPGPDAVDKDNPAVQEGFCPVAREGKPFGQKVLQRLVFPGYARLFGG